MPTLKVKNEGQWVDVLNSASGSAENGGYYIPSVDSGGNLSWTASKSGMPAVVPANIKGQKGDTGAAGYTPVRGVDYWTDADIAQIKSYVDDAILGGAW